MRMVQVIVAVLMVAASFAVGLFFSASQGDARATRQVEVKRVNLSAGQATTETLGVVVGISCVELSTGVDCFVVSTR